MIARNYNNDRDNNDSNIRIGESERTIISFNVDRIRNQLIKTRDFVLRERPIAAFIQDFPAMSTTELREFQDSIQGQYKIIANDLNYGFSNVANNETYYRTMDETMNSTNMDNNDSSSGSGISNGNTNQTHKLDSTILIRQEIEFESLTMPEHIKSFTNVASAVVHLKTKTSEESRESTIRRYPIYGLYIRPQDSYKRIRDILDWIMASASGVDKSRIIIMGDMNAISLEWAPAWSLITDLKLNKQDNSCHHYNQIKLNRGRMIDNYIRNHKLICLNNPDLGPTCINRASKLRSYIDVALVGQKAARNWSNFRLILFENSVKDSSVNNITDVGHRIIAIAPMAESPNAKSNENLYHYQLDRIRENHFAELKFELEKLCWNWKHLPRHNIVARMNTLCDSVYETIQSVQQSIQIKKNQPQSNPTDLCALRRAKIASRLANQLHHYQNLINNWKNKHKDRRLRSSDYQMNKRKSGWNRKIISIKQKILKNYAVNRGDDDDEIQAENLWEYMRHIERNSDICKKHKQHQQQINTMADLEMIVAKKFPHKSRQSLEDYNALSATKLVSMKNWVDMNH